MSGRRDEVIEHIELLYRHREAIAHAFRSRMPDADSMPGGRSAVDKLAMARALLPLDGSRFALNAELRSYLANVLRRFELFSQFPHLGREVDRLEKLFHSYRASHNSGDDEAMEQVLGDFTNACVSIQQAINGSIKQVSALFSGRMGDVRNMAEKSRQNEHYLGMTSELIEALNNLSDHTLRDDLATHPVYSDLLDAFDTNIHRNLLQWLSEAGEIHKTIVRYVHRFRDVHRDVRNIHNLNLFFKKNNEAAAVPEAAIAFGNEEIASAFTAAAPLKLSGFAFPKEEDAELVAIASQIPTETLAPNAKEPPRVGKPRSREQAKSELFGPEGEANDPLVRLRYEKARQGLVKSVRESAQPVSALAWLRRSPDVPVTERQFIETLYSDTGKDTVLAKLGVRARVQYLDKRYAVEGNRYFTDIVLEPARAPV